MLYINKVVGKVNILKFNLFLGDLIIILKLRKLEESFKYLYSDIKV